MNKEKKIQEIITTLRQETKPFVEPLVDIIIKEYGKDPYLILISCLLSLRAKDIVTIHVCRDLFAVARRPQEMVALSQTELEKIIRRIGFFKNKAQVLREVSRVLLETFDGRVPKTREQLLTIKGVGPKTASLVLGLAYDTPAVCVDVHVHRISNRLGLIQTKTPEESEAVLETLLPKKYWIEWNKLLVMWGQNVCAPVSPKCSGCVIKHLCKRIGVTKSR